MSDIGIIEMLAPISAINFILVVPSCVVISSSNELCRTVLIHRTSFLNCLWQELVVKLGYLHHGLHVLAFSAKYVFSAYYGSLVSPI